MMSGAPGTPERDSALRAWVASEYAALLSTFDFALAGASAAELLTLRPGSTENSIAWTVWHLARTEDVAVNAVIRDIPQIYDDGWRARLAMDDPRIGTGFTHDEVVSFGDAINVLELLGYWRAVHASTSAWLATVDIDGLDEIPARASKLESLGEIVPDDGAWLLDLWRGRSIGYVLRSAVITHGYIHLGEIQTIRGRLGVVGL